MARQLKIKRIKLINKEINPKMNKQSKLSNKHHSEYWKDMMKLISEEIRMVLINHEMKECLADKEI